MPHTTPPGLTGFTELLATLQPAGAVPGTEGAAANDSSRGEAGRWATMLPADWLQGRTAYGGLSAALCLEAALRSLPDLPPLRSAQFAFVGPATGALQITPAVLRQGKSAVFVGVDLVGDSGLAVRATLCFGAGRDAPQVPGQLPMPDTPPRATCPSYFGWPGQPNFMSHFEGRLAAGSMPMAGAPSGHMRVWVRHRDSADSGGLVSLVALADALPPAAFAALTEPVPISTMTWSIELLHPAPHSAGGWWLLDAQAETVAGGYSAQNTVVWHPDGHPVLVARQQVAIFGRRAAG